MLSNYRIDATIPAADITRARRFYEEKLGLTAAMELPNGDVQLQCGEGTMLFVFHTAGHPGGDHTQAGWTVDNVEAVVQDLRSRGVEFLEYDSGPFKTVNGIATLGPTKAAWFKDSESNTLAIIQAM